jgi:DNA-binding HxlR family transcriptional regulator
MSILHAEFNRPNLMGREDRQLLELVSDGVCHEILIRLLADGPQTQAQLRAAVRVGSGAISRRMADLENAGLVVRERSHGPYHLVLPQQTRELMEGAMVLAANALERRYATAAQELSEFRAAGPRGDRLRDRTREGA